MSETSKPNKPKQGLLTQSKPLTPHTPVMGNKVAHGKPTTGQPANTGGKEQSSAAPSPLPASANLYKPKPPSPAGLHPANDSAANDSAAKPQPTPQPLKPAQTLRPAVPLKLRQPKAQPKTERPQAALQPKAAQPIPPQPIPPQPIPTQPIPAPKAFRRRDPYVQDTQEGQRFRYGLGTAQSGGLYKNLHRLKPEVLKFTQDPANPMRELFVALTADANQSRPKYLEKAKAYGLEPRLAEVLRFGIKLGGLHPGARLVNDLLADYARDMGLDGGIEHPLIRDFREALMAANAQTNPNDAVEVLGERLGLVFAHTPQQVQAQYRRLLNLDEDFLEEVEHEELTQAQVDQESGPAFTPRFPLLNVPPEPGFSVPPEARPDVRPIPPSALEQSFNPSLLGQNHAERPVVEQNVHAWRLWNRLLDQTTGLGENAEAAIADIFALEGGLRVPRGATFASGLQPGTLDGLVDAGYLPERFLGADSRTMSLRDRMIAYGAVLNDGLFWAGGIEALESIGNTQAAVYLADTMFVMGRFTAATRVQQAIIDTVDGLSLEGEFALTDSFVDGQFGPNSIDAYDQLSAIPVWRERLFEEVQAQRADWFGDEEQDQENGERTRTDYLGR